MIRCAMLAAAALALCLLLAPLSLAWYKPAVGPRHYSVGRAAGLLSTFWRVPSARLSEPIRTGPPRRAGASLELRPSLRSLVSVHGPEGGPSASTAHPGHVRQGHHPEHVEL